MEERYNSIQPRAVIARRFALFMEAVKKRYKVDNYGICEMLGYVHIGRLNQYLVGDMPLDSDLILMLHKYYGLNESFLYRDIEENISMFIDRELEIIFNIIMDYEESKRERYKLMLKMMELPELEEKILAYVGELELEYRKIKAGQHDKEKQ